MCLDIIVSISLAPNEIISIYLAYFRYNTYNEYILGASVARVHNEIHQRKSALTQKVHLPMAD